MLVTKSRIPTTTTTRGLTSLFSLVHNQTSTSSSCSTHHHHSQSSSSSCVICSLASYHTTASHYYAKKKSIYNSNNKLRKPSPKTKNIIHLQYDPRVDDTPKKQEFLQQLQETDRTRIQKLIVEFDNLATAKRVIHTEIMGDVLKALRKFGTESSNQQQIAEQQGKDVTKEKLFIDRYLYMFSKQSLITDESFLSNFQSTLEKNGFLEKGAAQTNELQRFVQALIDPSFLVNAVRDISPNAIKHFSNIELKTFGTSLLDSLVRDYVMRFSVAETRLPQQDGSVANLLLEENVTSLVEVKENQVLPALTDLPHIPLTKQEILSIEKPLRNLATLKQILKDLGMDVFVRFVPFAQVYDPDHFHGISEEKSAEQLEIAAHSNVLRSLLGVYYMHHGMDKTWQLFNSKIVPLAINNVQESSESKDFTHYPNILKKFLLQQTKYEPEYRYIDVRSELQMSEALYSKRREKLLREVDMQREMDRSVYKANVIAGLTSEDDKDEQMHALIEYPDKYKLICVGLYVNDHLIDRAFSESYTQAKHKVARQVYEDITTSSLSMKKLRDKLVNTEYVHSVSKIAKLSRHNLPSEE